MTHTREAVAGLSKQNVSSLRYNSRNNNRYESTGLLISFMKKNKKLLDVGCGTGTITSTLRDALSLDVVGVEPHPERAEQARTEGLNVITGVYDQTFAQRNEKFDYILFADVLEHLVDPAEMLREVKNSLAPDGRVLASIPNVAHWTVRAQLLFGNFNYKPTGIMDATHLRWFTRRSVRRLFEAAGYEVEDIRGAAGGWMGVYRYTPFRFLPQDQKSFVLGQLCRIAPALFSVQHVIKARPK
ncbi:Methyltransferase domain-containing protein [Methylobacterium sp. 190mf]|nr:class I SAM-dependent methyltransferase [Methylobacterium oryzae]UIN35965.1 class I SAM-dependent methyltransferase [Methylobacterium oryzae]SEF49345.1 Methyltransferase domain-containing protein [Methylobacterium sp. 190mf]SEH27356.1 Methyltransferase domain-containing protein [Methylobacterium sp. 275MFSha3.1]